MIVRPQLRRRGGATVAEVAVVISVFLLFLFGVLEYCRFVLMLHVVTNACRDGSRYAVVDIYKPTNFDTTDYKDPAGTVYPSIVHYTRDRLSGLDGMITSATPTTYYSNTGSVLGTSKCKIEVFVCDQTQLNPTPPAVPTVAPDATATSWNDAEFGQRIAVRVSGTYKPALPNFLLMGATIPVNMAVTMGAE